MDSAITPTLIKAGFVYGMASIGNSSNFLQINPLHAAIFSIATKIFFKLGMSLAKNLEYHHSAIQYRSMIVVSTNTPLIVSIALKIFSPVQALTAFGLHYLACDGCYLLIGKMH